MTAVSRALSGTIRVRAPAKINLHLSVGALRPDGYHELVTVFHAVDLADELTVTRAQRHTVRSEPAHGVPVGAKNLAGVAARMLARRSGLNLDLVQDTLDGSIAESAIWRQRGPLMRERSWTPAPGPVATLHPILEQIEVAAAEAGLAAPVFAAAKEVFDKALADGWGDLDIACVHDQISGDPTLSQEGPS